MIFPCFNSDPGPQVGSIRVLGELAPAKVGETNTQTIMERFKDEQFRNFRHLLSAENGQIKLIPDTSSAYEGFSWERRKLTMVIILQLWDHDTEDFLQNIGIN